MVAGVEKFHTFCYGQSTIVLSDHKPLTSIMKKDLVNTPPRLQRLLLHSPKYSVEILYKAGKNMLFANHLSRNVTDIPSKVPTIPNLNLEVSSLELNASQTEWQLILTGISKCSS